MANADNTILSDVLAAAPHIAAWEKLFKNRLNGIDLSVSLVYLIDTVDASVLPYLAQQFDVTGYGGWRLAETETQKRELLKQAIELHKYKGTIWAIQQAMASVGFPDAVIEEHVGHWARFRVWVSIQNRSINAKMVADLREMILFWKNERSWLEDIAFRVDMEDSITLVDDYALGKEINEGDNLHVGGNFLYNGAAAYDGSHNYNSDTDVVEFEVI